MNRLLLSALLFICLYPLHGQDSTKWNTNFQFELKGQHIFSNADRSFFKDEFIQSVRRQNNPGYDNYFGFTGNPFSHYATYAGVFFNSSYQKKYHIDLGAYLEQRSFSGGSNNVSNIFWFPKIVLSVEDTLAIFKIKFPITLKVGDFYQPALDDFIRIYNTDFQGFTAKIGFKNFWVRHLHIADLSQNIGLGLHEYFRTDFVYERKTWQAGFRIDQNWLFQFPEIDHNFGLFAQWKANNLLSLYAQWDYRHNQQFTTRNMAYGLKGSLRWKHFEIELTGRYYEANFNSGYYYPRYIDYRIPNNSYLGKQFYALKNYYRKVNQWALFTEYQGLNIGNIELTLKFDQRIYKKWSLKGIFDYNLLLSERLPVHYPALTLAISLDLTPDLSLQYLFTNKHMNLDVHYETFYISKLMHAGVKIEKRL